MFKMLEPLGAIKWHSNKLSAYIKFKDCRVGSIRLSDHQSRERYSYTWEVNLSEKSIMPQIHEIVRQVKAKVKELNKFDPNKYIVFSEGKYQEVDTYKEYVDVIFRRKKKK